MLPVYQPWCPQHSRGPDPGLTCCWLGHLPTSRPRACCPSVTVVRVHVTLSGGCSRVFLAAVEKVPWTRPVGVGGQCPGSPAAWLAAGARRAWRRQHPQGQGALSPPLLPRYTLQGCWESGPHLCGRAPREGCTRRPACGTLSWPRAPVRSLSWTECLHLCCLYVEALSPRGRRLGLAEITRVGPRDGVSALLAEEEAPELTECPVRRAAVCRPEGRSSPGVQSASPRP